jgi:integrase
VKPITNAKAIVTLQPRAARYHVRDGKVTGLELRVSPNGEKTWTLRYRASGERRRMKLGAWPRLGLAEARKRANRELRKVDGGIDPQVERRAAADALVRAKRDSIDALCSSYVERHAKVKNRTWRVIEGELRREVLAKWKGRPVTSVTRRDCQELIQAIADRGAPIVANRIVARLSRLFRFAVETDLLLSNPAQHLVKPGVEASQRDPDAAEKPYTADEIRAIWQATEPLGPTLQAVYRLGLLTGQRPSEILDLEWDEIDGAWWTIPTNRTKNGRTHRVYLTATARALLAAIPRVIDEPLVCIGWRGQRQMAEYNRQVFSQVRPRIRPRHAMRDTVATGLAEAGVAIEDISKVLNHATGSRMTAVYNAYSYDKEKRLAMGKWERRLLGMLDEKPTASSLRLVSS